MRVSVINFCVLLGLSSDISITSEAHDNIANNDPEHTDQDKNFTATENKTKFSQKCATHS